MGCFDLLLFFCFLNLTLKIPRWPFEPPRSPGRQLDRILLLLTFFVAARTPELLAFFRPAPIEKLGVHPFAEWTQRCPPPALGYDRTVPQPFLQPGEGSFGLPPPFPLWLPRPDFGSNSIFPPLFFGVVRAEAAGASCHGVGTGIGKETLFFVTGPCFSGWFTFLSGKTRSFVLI